MMTRRDTDCRRVAPGLTALAAGEEPIRDQGFVIDHLGRCEVCLDALEDLTLTAHALRRLGDLAERADLDDEAWPRLRVRILRSRSSAAGLVWRWRTTVAGSIAGVLVVAVVAAPLAFRLPLGASGSELVGDRVPQRSWLGLRTDDDNDPTLRWGGATLSDTSGPTSGLSVRFPDGIAPVAKEVQTRQVGRPMAAD